MSSTAFSPLPKDLPVPRFGTAAGAHFKALGYLFSSGTIFGLTLLCFLVNGAILVAAFWYGHLQLGELTDWVAGLLPAYEDSSPDGFFAKIWDFMVWAGLKSASVLLETLKWLLFALVIIYIGPTLYNLLMGINPLSIWAVGKIFTIVFERESGGKMSDGLGIGSVIVVEIRKVIAYVITLVFLLLSNLIPMIGQVIFAVGSALLAVKYAGWSAIGPYYESLSYNYPLQKQAVARQRVGVWGIGSPALIPGLSLIMIFLFPIAGAVVAADVNRKLTGAHAA